MAVPNHDDHAMTVGRHGFFTIHTMVVDMGTTTGENRSDGEAAEIIF